MAYRESFNVYRVNTLHTPLGGRATWLDLPKAGPKPVTRKKPAKKQAKKRK